MYTEHSVSYHGSLSQFIKERYYPFYQNTRPKDIYAETTRINVLLSCEIAKKELTEINRNDVISFLAEVRAKRAISKTTVNRYHSRLCTILNYALNEGYIPRNPAGGLKKNREPMRERFLLPYEINSLLYECKQSKNYELYTIVALALNTGMRLKEILTLSKKRVSVRNRNIFLEQSLTKSGENRNIPLNDAAVRILTEYVNTYKYSIDMFKTKCIRTAFYNAMKRAGIEQACFHDLRRTFATHLKEAGVPIHTISRLLGHSNITVTERYLSVKESMLLESVSKISFF
jgi:integrase